MNEQLISGILFIIIGVTLILFPKVFIKIRNLMGGIKTEISTPAIWISRITGLIFLLVGIMQIIK